MGRPGLSFEDLLQTSCACGVLSIEPGGAITFISPEAEKILRLTAGQTTLDALPAALQALVRECQSTGQAINDRKIALEAERGNASSISATVMPAAAREKKIMVLLKDFSSTKKLERSLRRLDRLASAGTLSAGMAHEIRNALVAVKTFVDLLLEKNKEEELAEIVSQEMVRMVSMVSQILKFAVPAHPVFTAISVHKILDRTLLLAQHRVEGRQVTFERKLEAQTDVLDGDAHQLEQAFVNLLLNGVEAINTSGTLAVTSELLPGRSGANCRSAGCAFAFRTAAGASRRRTWAGCSNRFSPPNKTAPALAWPSRAASLKNTTAASRWRARPEKERPSP